MIYRPIPWAMTTGQLSLATIDAAEAAEDARHAKQKQRFANARKAFRELQELLEEPLGKGAAAAVAASAVLVKGSDDPAFDPKEYGGKKKLLLRIVAVSKSGKTSDDVISDAEDAGYPGARPEIIVPQLSALKGVDGYLVHDGGKWVITDKGLKYLGWK